MKKLIIISIFTLVIVCAGIIESVKSTNVFNQIDTYTQTVCELLENKDEIKENTLKIETEISKIENTWSQFRNVALSFSNHNTIMNFTEKLVSIKRQFNAGLYEDAYVSAAIANHIAKHLAIENGVNPLNLF